MTNHSFFLNLFSKGYTLRFLDLYFRTGNIEPEIGVLIQISCLPFVAQIVQTKTEPFKTVSNGSNHMISGPVFEPQQRVKISLALLYRPFDYRTRNQMVGCHFV
jgi:hypothetical protein